MNKIRSSQYMIIFNDVLRSIILLTFLIFWHFESQRIVNEMVNKDALPSYYTLIVSNIVAKHPKDIVG